ncbi:MAG TPA: YceI family protein [Rhizomicrobium sp.]|jgi:polyisoprenoid-binding protein YceI
MRVKLVATLQVAAVVIIGLSVSAFGPVDAKKGTYKIDPRHTQIIFEIQHMGLSNFLGRLGPVSGTLQFDPAAPESSALGADVDMTTIDTHVPELDKELVGFFKADKFPTASFKATGITRTGDNTGTVTGDLTLAGITKPVTLNVTFKGARNPPIPFQPYRIGFDGTATIHRADFDLTHALWSGLVGDDVTLLIEMEGELQ